MRKDNQTQSTGFDPALGSYVHPSQFGIENVFHPWDTFLQHDANGPSSLFGHVDAPKSFTVQMSINGKTVKTQFDHKPTQNEIEQRARALSHQGQLTAQAPPTAKPSAQKRSTPDAAQTQRPFDVSQLGKIQGVESSPFISPGFDLSGMLAPSQIKSGESDSPGIKFGQQLPTGANRVNTNNQYSGAPVHARLAQTPGTLEHAMSVLDSKVTWRSKPQREAVLRFLYHQGPQGGHSTPVVTDHMINAMASQLSNPDEMIGINANNRAYANRQPDPRNVPLPKTQFDNNAVIRRQIPPEEQQSIVRRIHETTRAIHDLQAKIPNAPANLRQQYADQIQGLRKTLAVHYGNLYYATGSSRQAFPAPQTSMLRSSRSGGCTGIFGCF